MKTDALFRELAAELRAEDPRVVEGTIMNGPCLRVGKEFLVPKADRRRWRALLREGVAHAAPPKA